MNAPMPNALQIFSNGKVHRYMAHNTEYEPQTIIVRLIESHDKL